MLLCFLLWSDLEGADGDGGGGVPKNGAPGSSVASSLGDARHNFVS